MTFLIQLEKSHKLELLVSQGKDTNIRRQPARCTRNLSSAAGQQMPGFGLARPTLFWVRLAVNAAMNCQLRQRGLSLGILFTVR